jgi:hypothetical protein
LLNSSAGQLKPEEIERIIAVINAPTEHQIPSWFLNRQKDFATGETKQHVSNALSAALRDDLTRLKKIRCVFLHFFVCCFAFLSLYSFRSSSHIVELTVVSVITGTCVAVDNTRRPLAVLDVPSECPSVKPVNK